jgi:DNA-directed RNA polymerase subunit RPC12/RpoP
VLGSWGVFAANGGNWMRCMACGAEMILVKVIEDVTMPVPGFQRRVYMCSECNETEQRLVFNKPDEQ